jgi:hypothetical protein
MKRRNYVLERRAESPARKSQRAARNRARRALGLGVGDPRHADHKVPLSKGGSNSKRNLRAVKPATNLRKGARR